MEASKGCGAHQLRSPRSRVVAGTRRVRTMVASTMTATARPTPSCLMARTSPAAHPANTTTMSRAAEVMMRPVRWRPRATASSVSPVWSWISLTIDRRKTSYSMESPKAKISTRIGILGSMDPTGSKASGPERFPSWKIQTRAPKLAPRLTTSIRTALRDTTIEPVMKNSRTKVASSITPSAKGSLAVRRFGCRRGRQPVLRPGPPSRRGPALAPRRRARWQWRPGRSRRRQVDDGVARVGAQLCPCNIATATPQAFTVASRPATSPSQGVPHTATPCGCALLSSPDPPGSSWWVS